MREDARRLDSELARLDKAMWAKYFTHTLDPRAAYWAFDVLILPSYREGFPITLLEAQACGIPVITTDATGCKDAIKPGVTGLLVPTGDAEALTKAILEVARYPEHRTEMGRRGRLWTEDRFRQDDVRTRFLNYIDGVSNTNEGKGLESNE